MDKYVFEMIRCIIYFSIPLFLGYLISIIKSISKKKKEEAELISLKTVNEIIKTVVMSLEQTNVKNFKKINRKINLPYKLKDDQQNYVKYEAKRKVDNIINRNKKFSKLSNIMQLDEYIDNMIERKVLELNFEEKFIENKVNNE